MEDCELKVKNIGKIPREQRSEYKKKKIRRKRKKVKEKDRERKRKREVEELLRCKEAKL